MKNILYSALIFLFFQSFRIDAQFILNNNASITSPDCSPSVTTYQLTPNLNTQDGQIWYAVQVSLTQRFDIEYQMFLGSKPYTVGADGICFVFQQQSTNAGSSGGGLGYGGITPSLAVEFDTYANPWDPGFCHTAIEKNGDVEHTDLSGNNLAGPIQLSPTNPNLPDNAWHTVEIIWNPVYDSLSVYFDCNYRIGYQGDVINSIFGGNPNVYWGFTAGTGGSDNRQEVCITHSYLNNLRDTAVCIGDSVSLTVSGGASYSWAPNIGLNNDSDATIHAAPDSTTTYTVSITNSCGLISKDSVTITVNPLPKVNTVTTTNLLCNGVNSGSAMVNVINGSNPYTYLWTPSGETNATVTGLSAGTYTVTVKDKNGCAGTAATATATLTQPPALSPTTSFTQAACNLANGSATVNTTGGVGPYTYLWNSSGQTNAIATGVSAGTYTVTVTDNNGCTSTATVTVTQPSVVSAALGTIINPPCNGQTGSATVNITSGTAPYTYSWSLSGGTNATGTGLTAGTYTVNVTDNNGCTTSVSVTITQPQVVTAAMAAPINPLCNGEKGTATVTPGGGTAPYSYSWNSGGTNATDSLKAGTYTVTVKDAHGCSATASVTITQPLKLSATMVNPVNSICNQDNGSVTARASGGISNYSYLWAPNGQTSASITGLFAGNYTVTVTDANGCTATSSIAIATDSASINACCNAIIIKGNDTTIIATGDTSIRSYTWSPSVTCLNPPMCNSVSVSPTVTTTYTVIAIDTKGCEAERIITIIVDKPCFNFIVPNVITPTNSGTLGLDNVLYIHTMDLDSWSILIYDRWGKEMFSSTNQTQYWAGTTGGGGQAPSGVYYYIINATCNGNTYKKEGFVQLIR